MGADILPHAGSALSTVAILDLALSILTHKQSAIRRTGYVLLLLALYVSSTTLLALHTYSHTPPRDPTVVELKDSLSWTPTISTPAQELELGRLTRLIESTSSAFDPIPYSPAELKKDNSKPVTAVVLHWKRRKGLQLVLKQISRYPYIREIIIWNNQGGVDLLPSVSPFLATDYSLAHSIGMTGLYPRFTTPFDTRSTSVEDLQLPFQRPRRRKTFRVRDRKLSSLLFQRRRLAQYLHGCVLHEIPRLLR